MATFNSHVDSVDVNNSMVVVGLSALEGNVWDGGLQILNVENGETLAGINCPSGMAMVRFLGDSNGTNSIIGTVCDDTFIRLYRPADNDIELVEEWDEHEGIVSALACHREEPNTFATCGWDGHIYLWDLESGKDISRPVYSLLDAHIGPIHDISFSKIPSEPWHFASVGKDRLLRVWDKRVPTTHGCVQIYEHETAPLDCLEWSAGNDYSLYTGDDIGEILTFDLRKLHDPIANQAYPVHTYRTRCMRSILSKQSGDEYLLSGGDDCMLILSTIHSPASRFLLPPPLILAPPPGMPHNTTTIPPTPPAAPSSNTTFHGLKVHQQ